MPARSARSTHAIPVRKPNLEFDASIPRHWNGNNIVATHFFNGLNLVFPDGERFFVKSVHDHLSQITDPVLLDQAKGFAAQEGQHANQHEKYFERLRAEGFAIDTFLRRFHTFVGLTNKLLPAALRLSITAGAEHYTAVLGAGAIEDFDMTERLDPTMRKLIVWHAVEEIEHKAVAFDVLQATHPSYLLRVAGFAIASTALFVWTLLGTRMLIKQEHMPREVIREHRQLEMTRVGEKVRKRIGGSIRDYLRPGFHPNQTDHLALARQRLAQLMPSLATA